MPAMDGLPDPEVLQRAALAMVAEAPEDWSTLCLIVWYEEEDVYAFRMWVESPGVPRRWVQPPMSAHRELDGMRDRQIFAGQEPWLRCDLRVARESPTDEPDFSADFAYGVGEVPE